MLPHQKTTKSGGKIKRWVAPIEKGGWHQFKKPPEGAVLGGENFVFDGR
jgi:hypothetical protein